MSFSKKVVTTYSKSLFQNTKGVTTDEFFNINKITSLENNTSIPDVHLMVIK